MGRSIGLATRSWFGTVRYQTTVRRERRAHLEGTAERVGPTLEGAVGEANARIGAMIAIHM